MTKANSNAKKSSPELNPEFVSEVRKAAAEHCEESSDLDTDDQADRTEAPKKPARFSAMSAIVGAALDASLSRGVRRRLQHAQAIAVVIQVPSPDWVEPVARHFKQVFGDRWMMHSRDGSNRTVHKSSVGSSEVARELARGLCVVGIAVDIELLPAALTTAADLTVRIGAPTGAVLRVAITRFARRSPGEIADGIAAGLDLYEMAAAFRPGTGPRKILDRIAAANAARRQVQRDRVPALATAVEYGDARVWGLDLARDIADYRAGRIAWRDVDRGICLHSPPGLGKTLFARVLARACDVPLVSSSVGELFASSEGYLDSVIKASRATFARAAALAPCILHWDEIDALPNRATMSGRAKAWFTVAVTDFLTSLDATISTREGVVVVCSTNAIKEVDFALLRPGRLEKVVEIKRPDLAGTINILKFHLNGELAGDLTEVGGMMEGSTGAEIMHTVRSARRIARHAGRGMTIDDLKRSAVPVEDIPSERLFRMSVHEAAHAVAAVVIKVGTLKHVALRARGSSGGQTIVDFSSHLLLTRRQIEDRVVVGLAARTAERIIVGAASSGAGGSADSDLAAATRAVASLHASLGMGDDLVYLGAGEDLLRELSFSSRLRDTVERHLRELEARAAELVEHNREAILEVAEELASRRFLSGGQVIEIVRRASVATEESYRRPPDKETSCLE